MKDYKRAEPRTPINSDTLVAFASEPTTPINNNLRLKYHILTMCTQMWRRIHTCGLGDDCKSYLGLQNADPVHHRTHQIMKCMLNKDIYITDHILFGFRKKTAHKV